MKLEEWDLQVQIENPVDFDSLNFHRCSIRSYYEEQGLMDYFRMLNGPTYEALVRHFWVRAKFYNKAASLSEESQMVLMYPELEGKTREKVMQMRLQDSMVRLIMIENPRNFSRDSTNLGCGQNSWSRRER